MEDNGDEEEAKPQVEKAEGSVAGSAMEIGSPAKQAEEQLVRDGADKQDDATNVDPNDDVTGKTSDEDSVLIPPSTHTLFIKALSPDISRADLETVCRRRCCLAAIRTFGPEAHCMPLCSPTTALQAGRGIQLRRPRRTKPSETLPPRRLDCFQGGSEHGARPREVERIEGETVAMSCVILQVRRRYGDR